ncbi:response regulator [Roseibacterium sp. SDUM158016]|jgi:CheY-like chemotaxis protein|uniref:response regulator n=1 Tax=Roseicyclus sediminis TaxID=2980997 RepID=UPI0021D2651D|nr:response regulator [Roseibacterium sp. SDUM158016]MCU4651571.1 response regulator [Roseibacterium sp. SDUM158016]
MKILAVDDDPDFQAVLKTVLEGLGYGDLVLAQSGTHALELIERAPTGFDCFILDIQMPGMDGIELCRKIRSMEAYKDTPIVMNTAVADRDHIDAAFAAGATDYLNKPVDEVEIKARLGVIERLVSERLRAQVALSSPGTDTFAAPSYGFMDGIPLKRVDGAVDLFAMGNYLKTLGMFRALSVCAVGVRVVNARRIHDLEGGYVFGEVMIDVGTCLADCLEPATGRMIAYAGGGVFVCLLSRADMPEPEILADRLREYINEFQEVYADLDIQLPTISVGPAVHIRAVQLGSPTRIIDEAIAAVKAKEMDFATTA